MQRVCVFVDYQNAYMQARRCFWAKEAPPSAGQFDPTALGELLLRRRLGARFDGELHQVRLYRGLPDDNQEPRANAAVKRQSAAWTCDPRVVVVTRPLRYLNAADHAAVADTRNYARS